MSAEAEAPNRWADYYQATARRPPRELYRQTVARFEPAGSAARLAIDLGCGAGIESLDLLSRGWRVLAIDKEPGALDLLLGRVPPEQRERLVPQVADFEHVDLPAADLVWAGLSLPFCPPDAFPALWAKILAALSPGGRFAGDFFGDRTDRRAGWLSSSRLTFLSRAQVTELLAPLQLEYFMEEEGQLPTATSGLQYIHSFGAVARRP
jgi:tellurite methyltransferase